MRKTLYALIAAFALGSLAPLAQAGEGCAYGDHAVKKNDVETPPPSASATKKKQES